MTRGIVLTRLVALGTLAQDALSLADQMQKLVERIDLEIEGLQEAAGISAGELDTAICEAFGITIHEPA